MANGVMAHPRGLIGDGRLGDAPPRSGSPPTKETSPPWWIGRRAFRRSCVEVGSVGIVEEGDRPAGRWWWWGGGVVFPLGGGALVGVLLDELAPVHGLL